MNWDAIDKMRRELREEHRIKDGTDYALTHKFGDTHVLCCAIWEETIVEVAAKHRVTITKFHTYC